MPHAVPELSLQDFYSSDAAAQSRFIEALWDGFRYFGFIILKDHGVSVTLLEEAYQYAADFFALDDRNKSSYICGRDGQRGYTPFGREHAKDSMLPDLKEFWHIGREATRNEPLPYPENIWPTEIAGFKAVYLKLYGALEAAGKTMLRALEPKLEVPPGFFDEMTLNGNSILRLLHYPPVAEDVPVGAIRAAAHEDINLITILVAANGAGLELLDRDGQWLPIETDPNHLIVDAGDMLARITNDIIPATTHRVVNPTGPNQSRYSMPFFMHPHPHARLECIESCFGSGAKYPAITAQQFLEQRLAEIGLS